MGYLFLGSKNSDSLLVRLEKLTKATVTLAPIKTHVNLDSSNLTSEEIELETSLYGYSTNTLKNENSEIEVENTNDEIKIENTEMEISKEIENNLLSAENEVYDAQFALIGSLPGFQKDCANLVKMPGCDFSFIVIDVLPCVANLSQAIAIPANSDSVLLHVCVR